MSDKFAELIQSGVCENKVKMISSALKGIQKECGKSSVDIYSTFGDELMIERVSTGLISVDLALGGGLPRGDFIELYGKPQAGKTTFCFWIMGYLQKAGKMVAFIDAEQDFDPTWARKNGVNLDTLLISQPESLEQAMTIAEGLIKSNAVDLIVIDSLAALTPQTIIKQGIDKDTMGLRARKMGQFFDKTKSFVKTSGSIVLFTNQWRESLNMFQASDSPGGWNSKHSFGVRMRVSRTGGDMIKIGDEYVAQKGNLLITKNKVAPPYKKADFRINFDTGISAEYDLIDFAIQLGIIEKAGSWYKYEGETLVQGEDNFVEMLQENIDLFNEMNKKTREAVNS